MSEQPESECFVAYASCGHIVAAVVDNPEHRSDTAKTVAKWIKDGLRVNKATSPEVRAAVWCPSACDRRIQAAADRKAARARRGKHERQT